MRNGKLRKAVRLSGMAVAGLAMCLLLGFPAWAGSDCNCEKITIAVTAHAATPDPIGQYVGTALMTLGGQKKIYYADVVINPQGLPSFSADGTIRMQLRNQYSIPELASTFELYEHVTLVPETGDLTRYTITNQLVIFNSTGVFSEAYGKLVAHGEFSMAEGSISAVGEGLVCDLAEIK